MADGRYHHGDLRRALIEAAVGLLGRDGLDGVSMRAAAREAGVSNAAPYRHFRDRDELMSAVAASGHERLWAEIQEAMAEVGDDALLRLRAQGVQFVRFARADPAMFLVMHHAPWMAVGVSPEMDRYLERVQGVTEGEAEAGQAQGTMSSSDVQAQVLACRALVYGLARMYVDGHAEVMGLGADDALVEQVIDVIGVGLIPR